jgi:uncharacterized protein (TIGR02246 family)
MQTPAQLIESFQNAWENHDANALGALFVEEAEFINVFGEHLHGRQQIVTEHAMTFSNTLRQSTIVFRQVSSRPLSESMVLVHAEWTMHNQLNPSGGVFPPPNGIMTIIAIRDKADTSQILSLHNALQSNSASFRTE